MCACTLHRRCLLPGSGVEGPAGHSPAVEVLCLLRGCATAHAGARQLDLRLVMNDLCELVMEQVGAGLVRGLARRRWAVVDGRALISAAWRCLQINPDALPLMSDGCHLSATWPAPCLHPPPRCTALQLELYRDTRESILTATQQPNCLRDMSPAARDRALEREMRAEKNLHPALQTPDGHYKVRRGLVWWGAVWQSQPSCVVHGCHLCAAADCRFHSMQTCAGATPCLLNSPLAALPAPACLPCPALRCCSSCGL